MILRENLVQHAERELKLAGLDDPESDYGGLLYKAVIELIKKFSKQGHSGYSAGMVRQLFNKLSNYETLTPVTDDPEEWGDVSDISDMKLWQNKRDPRYFSEDGGKTWWNVDKKKIKECLDTYYKNTFIEKRFKSLSNYLFESMNSDSEKVSDEIMSSIKFQPTDIFFENAFDRKKITEAIQEKAKTLLENSLKSIDSKKLPAGDIIRIVPLFECELQYKGVGYPLFFKASIKGESKFGDQLFAYFFNGVLYKFDIYKDSLAMVVKDKAVRQFSKDYIASKSKPSSATIEKDEKFPLAILIDENGEVVDTLVKKDSNYNLYTKEQTFSLAKGRILQVYVPFKSDYFNAEIISVDNLKSFKQDKFFEITFSINIDGKSQKMNKKLKPGDKIKIEHNDEWILCKVADNFFKDDRTSKNSLSLKYIAVK